MKTFIDCIPCFVKQTVACLEKAACSESAREQILRKVLRLMSEMDFCTSPPAMAKQIHNAVSEIANGADMYVEDKRMLNDYAMSLIPDMRKLLARNPESLFENLIRLSIAGNIMDLGVYEKLSKPDIVQSIGRCMQAKIDTNAVGKLREEIDKAEKILYLGDNAGEIVFDRLFMEHMPREKFTYVVRGAPVINDVTRTDAGQVNMSQLVNVIDSGCDAPGTILADCSQKFREEFEKADLIIAKGQGNYETLSDVDKSIAFLLQAKCSVIARDIGCEPGSFIIKVCNAAHHYCGAANRYEVNES
jgi:uncharacterized protein with ATP-grasp and redox domains